MDFKTTIYDLGEDFYQVVKAAKFPKKVLRYSNWPLQKSLNLNFDKQELEKHFCDFKPIKGSLKQALALKYHGHQFLHYNPQIGDGRGFLFAQVKVGTKLYDFGTKGSGTTPYSRSADGRLTLKGAVRETLASEYLFSHGVNTSKAFCFFETGEELYRNDEPSPTRSAVLTRLSHSHIRIGTFQRLLYLNEIHNIEKLLNYVCENYYPGLQNLDLKQKASAFLAAVSGACAKTCAQWMMSGFVHGVLNTDNINITGESFDYGPYRFLPYYDPNFVAAYFDHEALYAYGKQPNNVYWNLKQLALCFRHILDEKEQISSIANYSKAFSQDLLNLFLRRLNLRPKNMVENNKLFSATFNFLEVSKVPFEHFFYDWTNGIENTDVALKGERKDFYKGEEFNDFFLQLKHFEAINFKTAQEKVCHLYIDEIEKIWQAIATKDDWSLFDNKIKAIRNKNVF